MQITAGLRLVFIFKTLFGLSLAWFCFIGTLLQLLIHNCVHESTAGEWPKKKSLRKTYSTHVPAAELQLNNAFSTASTEFSGWNIKWKISRGYFFLLQKHFKKTTTTCINDFNEHWNVCSVNSQRECDRKKHNIAPHSSGPVVNNNLSAGCIPV